MNSFLSKFENKINGVLSGFDRLIFHGGIRSLMYEAGMAAHLYSRGVYLTEFKDYAPYCSQLLKKKTEESCLAQGRPFIYLNRGGESKEKKAESIAEKDQIKSGLICNFSTLEMGNSYKVVGNRATEKLELKNYPTKCLHIYHYWMDPEFGLMHARIQTWFPFRIQIYCNGKRWLANQMQSHGIEFIQKDNCFTWVSDVEKTNELAGQQIKFNFSKVFDRIAQSINLIFDELFPQGEKYYWTLAQSEWAQDILFKNTESLNNVYTDFVRHGMLVFDSPDVIRFLQQKLTKTGFVNGNFKGEVVSDFKNRQEGIRIKHSIKSNSVKFYNKAGSVLRIEATINDPSDFRVFRPNINTGELQWQQMRKSVDDIKRRAEVSTRIVEHYADALTLANVEENLIKLIQPTLVRKEVGSQKIRALDPLGKDREMLKAIINGKFHINGFRNKDIRTILFKESNQEQNKKNSAKVSRLLKILKTHGIIKKVNKTHRYEVTKNGIKIISALNIFENSKVETIMKMAA
jgi:hypothetical protein